MGGLRCDNISLRFRMAENVEFGSTDMDKTPSGYRRPSQPSSEPHVVLALASDNREALLSVPKMPLG